MTWRRVLFSACATAFLVLCLVLAYFYARSIGMSDKGFVGALVTGLLITGVIVLYERRALKKLKS